MPTSLRGFWPRGGRLVIRQVSRVHNFRASIAANHDDNKHKILVVVAAPDERILTLKTIDLQYRVLIRHCYSPIGACAAIESKRSPCRSQSNSCFLPRL